MTVYRSRNALTGPLTPDRITELQLPVARRGYRVEDVDALLHRLTFELAERTRQLVDQRAENRRINRALRSWQSEQARARHAAARAE
ncbi:DivIVA domain-containing protein [Micromonospora sp. R77]|uniref:DivIVA domain-containing protein n=1 Tax=Micromonospora sp. R77 TaxID=2925836 RepID=UPI001F60C551|nr:DivIVA domain-containing protein [Micromonospora sp. R77]MCI4064509.1 DivIVA domain-containing protein [Micromonospora sp. R77]